MSSKSLPIDSKTFPHLSRVSPSDFGRKSTILEDGLIAKYVSSHCRLKIQKINISMARYSLTLDGLQSNSPFVTFLGSGNDVERGLVWRVDASKLCQYAVSRLVLNWYMLLRTNNSDSESLTTFGRVTEENHSRGPAKSNTNPTFFENISQDWWKLIDPNYCSWKLE